MTFPKDLKPAAPGRAKKEPDQTTPSALQTDNNDGVTVKPIEPENLVTERETEKEKTLDSESSPLDEPIPGDHKETVPQSTTTCVENAAFYI